MSAFSGEAGMPSLAGDANDPKRTSAPPKIFNSTALWHLPSVEVRQLHCRISYWTDRYGRVEFSATGICPDQARFASGRAFATAKPDTTAAKGRITALRKGLQEEGFIEGTNYSLAVRSSISR